MDLVTTLWIASVLGAASFFICGLASHAALARRQSIEPAPAQPDPRLPIVESALARATHDAQAHAARAAALEHELAQARTQATARDRELAQARAQAAAHAHEQTAAATRTHELTQAQQQLQREVTGARAQASALVRELAQAKEQHARELAQAKGQGARELAQANEQLARELAQTKEQHIRELTQKEKYARELVRAKEETAALVKQLADAKKPVAKPARARPRPEISRDTLEANLSAQLGSLAEECGYEVVVLSDEQGLLLAGVGDEHAQGTIAALSSVARELSTRAAEFVALQPVVLEVAADDGRKLRVRLFQWEKESIALASFGASRIAPAEEEESVITVFPTLMAAS
jgi:hypothetical protein